jgi:hypothetical protein
VTLIPISIFGLKKEESTCLNDLAVVSPRIPATIVLKMIVQILDGKICSL